MGEWRKLHNEELRHSSPNIIRIIESEEDKMGWACGTNVGEEERV
jgi:hypothetical protein